MARFALLTLCLPALIAAESGLEGWLRYAPIPHAAQYRNLIPSHIVALNSTSSSPVYTAGQELQKGIASIFGKTCQVGHSHQSTASSVVIGTIDDYPSAHVPHDLYEDGFWLNTKSSPVEILGQNARGALYGTFEYLSMLAQGNFTKVAYASSPDAPIRWTNEWDNLDGSIERGFGGASIFFANGTIVSDLTRAAEYARLLASIGINAVVVNNVNANASILSPANVEGLGEIADVFRPWGVRLALSQYFGSPSAAVNGRANLTTFDPLDPSVVQWWTNVTNSIYARIPDMAGYLVKANSEGQPGPLTYNRTLAEGANLFANALKPHGGIVMFRAFVYNQLNESVWTADRANAAVDFFKPLDGDFDDNVVVQIKYGPIDFQVEEPVSPLFANLRQTSSAIELQVTQEYLGQQCHLVYLAPLWKEKLDFDLRVDDEQSLTRDIVSGSHFKRPLGGYAGVVNVGTNSTWLGSHLAMSNLYAFGRLAWDPTLSSEGILQDWIRLTFGFDRVVLDTITDMSMASWPAYKNYSGNLGIQTLTDILYTHYGPNPQSQDNNGWGQWTRVDHTSIGMDRTVSNGTGFAGQYPAAVAAMYEEIATTPDEFMLWFHHVNYTQRLHSGKTVIQHFYDAHYAGADRAQEFVQQWDGLQGRVDAERFNEVSFRQHYQAGHALVWRDAIVNFYHNRSGIADDAGRVGHHPYRIEAESMHLDGYHIYTVAPFETASNATAIVTNSNTTAGTASIGLNVPSGIYDIAVNYFDMYGGSSSYTLQLGDKIVGTWKATQRPWVDGREGPSVLGHTPSIYLDGHSAIRTTFHNVKVTRGDTLKVNGQADGTEPAPLDYVSVLPCGQAD